MNSSEKLEWGDKAKVGAGIAAIAVAYGAKVLHDRSKKRETSKGRGEVGDDGDISEENG